MEAPILRAAVVTVSTRSSKGQRPDTSGPTLCGLIGKDLGQVTEYLVVPDDRQRISSCLVRLCGRSDVDLLFTLGGTGLAPSDVTPEATEAVLERRAPGIAEALRAKSLLKTDRAMLSRGIAGVRGRTLIINLPGSERAVRECFQVVRPVLEHAVELLRGEVQDCARPAEESQK